MFSQNYRARHEPDAADLIHRIMRLGQYSDAPENALLDYLSARDQRLFLELESAHPLFYMIEGLVHLFPTAKFILTIRDCYTWLDSIVNQHYVIRTEPESKSNPWVSLLNSQYLRPDMKYTSEEWILRENGLAPIENYLSFWVRHNEKMLKVIPSDQLLIVRTHELLLEMPRLADFIGIPKESLDSSKAHSHKRDDKKINLLSSVSWRFIEEKVRLHCKPLMSKFFPDIRDLNDLKELNRQSLHNSVNAEWLGT